MSVYTAPKFKVGDIIILNQVGIDKYSLTGTGKGSMLHNYIDRPLVVQGSPHRDGLYVEGLTGGFNYCDKGNEKNFDRCDPLEYEYV